MNEDLCPICEEGTLIHRKYNSEINLVRSHVVVFVTDLEYSICTACGSEMVNAAQSRRNKKRIENAKQQLYRRSA